MSRKSELMEQYISNQITVSQLIDKVVELELDSARYRRLAAKMISKDVGYMIRNNGDEYYYIWREQMKKELNVK